MRGLVAQTSFALDILRSKITRKYKPFQMQISLTNRCNLKCSYCYAMYPAREEMDLSTAEILTLIDEMAAAGTRRINLVGGEPLLRKDIDEIVTHIRSKKIECAMTTNGYLVPRKLETVRKLNLITLSLDGDREATDLNRAVGCYDKVIEAIRVLKQEKIVFQVSAVLTKHSIHSFEHVLKMGKEMGFTVGFTTLIEQTIDGKKQAPPNLPTDDEYREILAKIIAWKREGYPILFSEKVIQYAHDWKLGFQNDKVIGSEPDFDHIRCNAGKFFGIIDVNGDVFPCPATVDVMKPLNAKKVGFKKAFDALNDHNCRTCHIPCQNEFSRMYDFDPGVIRNILKNFKTGA